MSTKYLYLFTEGNADMRELLGGKETRQALKSGMGSLFGFLCGTVLKCILCGYFAWEFVSALVQQ